MNFSLCNFSYFLPSHTHTRARHSLQPRNFASNFGVEVCGAWSNRGWCVFPTFSIISPSPRDPTSHIRHCYWHNEEDKVVLGHSTVRSVYKLHSTLRTHQNFLGVRARDVQNCFSYLFNNNKANYSLHRWSEYWNPKNQTRHTSFKKRCRLSQVTKEALITNCKKYSRSWKDKSSASSQKFPFFMEDQASFS